MVYEINQDSLEQYKRLKKFNDYYDESEYLPSSAPSTPTKQRTSTIEQKKWGKPDYSLRSDAWVGGYSPYSPTGKPRRSYVIKGEIKKLEL